MLAIGTQGGRIKILNVATKHLRLDVAGHNDIVRCVSVCAPSTFLEPLFADESCIRGAGVIHYSPSNRVFPVADVARRKLHRE